MAQDASARQTRREDAAFDLKGAVSSLTVLRLRTADLVHIESELFERVDRTPSMLLNAPVVVDFGALEGGGRGIDFEKLAAALRRCQVVPIAASNVAAEVATAAACAGLGSIPLGPMRSRKVTEPPREAAVAVVAEAVEAVVAEVVPSEAVAIAPAAAPSYVPTMTLTQPVRSGQVVYAQRGDLVVMAGVNPGAQVIADGHIHIYGPLRGRALAGAAGNAEARIFCASLAAELVSVAGEYLMADDIPQTLRGKPAQVLLRDGRPQVTPL
jgi:septum site-determining protein MinC